MLSAANKYIIQNIMHHLVALGPGILSQNQFRLYTCSLRSHRDRVCVCLKEHFHPCNFLWRKKNNLFPVMAPHHTCRDNHSELRCAHFLALKIQFRWLHFVAVLSISASEAHLTLPGNGLQSLHCDQTYTSALRVTRCKLCQKMWLRPLPSVIWFVGTWRSNLTSKLSFSPSVVMMAHN